MLHALAYIAQRPVETKGTFAPPSEQYLCAIHQHLREHHEGVDTLTIRRVDGEHGGVGEHTATTPDGEHSPDTASGEPAEPDDAAPAAVAEEGEWVFPGERKLTLAGFIVVANTRRAKPWKMPATIPEVGMPCPLAAHPCPTCLSTAARFFDLLAPFKFDPCC